MHRVAAAVGLVALAIPFPVALAGCVHGAEGIVRERAATEFACADYALEVEEVGPEVYRASGCGQEVIYACRPAKSVRIARADGAEPTADDFADTAAEPTMVCARRPR
jgi:hypothetical protein